MSLPVGSSYTLLASLAPTVNKVKAIVSADLATSAARGGDYDRVQSLSQRPAPLAARTECSLAIEQLLAGNRTV